ncbi:MAG: transglutaminase family protein [Pseudomonadota bacterium]
MTISIRHRTEYRYAPKAARVGLRLKLFPLSTPQQEIGAWEVAVNGIPVAPLITNPFGEGEAMWFSSTPLEDVEVTASGTVTLRDTSGVLGKLGRFRASVFCRATTLTEIDQELSDFASGIEGETPLARMHALSEAVHAAISYRKGVTASDTTAAQALALGAGVCQDLTHVFIASARAMGMPARYVTGYLLEDADEDGATPELATHAWAEVYLDGLGWTGFDPTHEVCPADRHIRLCSGFDAADAAPLRGHVTGETEESMEISVEIARSQIQSQSQS